MTHTRVLTSSTLLVILAATPVQADAQTTELYWAGSSSGLHRISLAGGVGPSQFVADIPVPWYAQMSVHEDKLYWIGIGDQLLYRANLDGSALEQVAIGSLPPDAWLALRGGVQTTDGDLIFALDQDPVTGQRFSPAANVVADYQNGKMYWIGGWNDGGAGIIGRSNLDGTSPEVLLDELDFQDYTLDLVLDVAAGKMYWNNPNHSRIQRANLDGTGLEDVATGIDPTALALHSIPEPAAGALAMLALMALRRPRRKL